MEAQLLVLSPLLCFKASLRFETSMLGIMQGARGFWRF